MVEERPHGRRHPGRHDHRLGDRRRRRLRRPRRRRRVAEVAVAPSREGRERVALALGSNLGDRLAHLSAGIAGLSGSVRIVAVSSVYASDPVGYRDQPEFLNAVVVGVTDLSPRRLLRAMQAVERARGRERPFAGAPRTLDLDLVLHGDRTVSEPDLVVPHPRWPERPFVVAPLREVAPDWRDPRSGLTVEAVARGLGPALDEARRVAPGTVLLGGGPGEETGRT